MKSIKILCVLVIIGLILFSCGDSGGGSGDDGDPGPADIKDVASDIAALDGSCFIFSEPSDNLNSITEDFTLPLSGDNGTTVSWSSSRPAYISVSGGDASVSRPYKGDNEDLTLTATVEKGSASDTKDFLLTVINEEVIFLFAMPSTNGNIGGRAAADSACLARNNSNYSHLNCNNVHAFLSFSASDEIRDMPSTFSIPTDRRVLSPDGTEIAGSWQSIINARDYPLTNSLADAGVTAETYFWSGSYENGMSSGSGNGDCLGWCTSNSSQIGQVGSAASTDQGFLQAAGRHCHITSIYLAICWKD